MAEVISACFVEIKGYAPCGVPSPFICLLCVFLSFYLFVAYAGNANVDEG